jgi:arylsulfatase A-like enzyme
VKLPFPTMHRPSILLRSGLASLAMISLAGACRTGPPAADTPRDVVIVSLDTTRIDRMSLYGAARPTTPMLDSFAAGAVVYERAWSTSSWTLPAHASMFTGRMPRAHGAHNHPAGSVHLSEQIDDPNFHGLRANGLGDAQVTLAEVLVARGYATGAFVGGPWLAPRFGAMQGFETVDADIKDIGGRRADAVTDAALAWADALPAERPMLLFVNYFDAHWPYEPPAGHAEAVRGSEAASDWDAYDGEIHFADSQLGRLLEGLGRRASFDDALVVVVGDHGDLFGEHGAKGHANWLWEELVRVPLVVRDRRAAAGRSGAPVSVMDLPAIVAGALAIELPGSFHSLAPGTRKELLAEVYRLEMSIFLQGKDLDRDLAAILQPPWKGIADSRGGFQLYNVFDDPQEAHDRASREPGLAGRLATRLAAWQASVDLPEPAPLSVDSATREQLRGLGYVE